MSKKSNKAFIDKIKTITIGTKSGSSAPKCPDCGLPMTPVSLLVRVKRMRPGRSDEQSFSA